MNIDSPPGFSPVLKIKGKLGDSEARIIPLECRKKQHVPVMKQYTKAIMTAKPGTHFCLAFCNTLLGLFCRFSFSKWKLFSIIR